MRRMTLENVFGLSDERVIDTVRPRPRTIKLPWWPLVPVALVVGLVIARDRFGLEAWATFEAWCLGGALIMVGAFRGADRGAALLADARGGAEPAAPHRGDIVLAGLGGANFPLRQVSALPPESGVRLVLLPRPFFCGCRAPLLAASSSSSTSRCCTFCATFGGASSSRCSCCCSWPSPFAATSRCARWPSSRRCASTPTRPPCRISSGTPSVICRRSRRSWRAPPVRARHLRRRRRRHATGRLVGLRQARRERHRACHAAHERARARGVGQWPASTSRRPAAISSSRWR